MQQRLALLDCPRPDEVLGQLEEEFAQRATLKEERESKDGEDDVKSAGGEGSMCVCVCMCVCGVVW